ncbi:DUF3892 domain-containing protein [Streptosporangium algeriense]|uniref:DUF3892 domain-containing protein n=1 Tax=Streptosporangium algeriense TaxID=1682748 RepID=A0ABW3DGH0_9ACTN
MAIKIIAIRLVGGNGHEHISRLWWVNSGSGENGENSREEIIAWIETKNGEAYVEDARGNRADVGVVKPNGRPKYLRTYADGKWTDNLLALPRK